MTTEPVQVKLQYVFEKYDIRPKENFKFSFFSMANEVFFLRDTKGRRLVLKNCLKNRSRALLEAEFAVVEHLRSHGCGAAEVVKSKDGDAVVEYNGDFWMMTKHLKGHMPSWNHRLRWWHLRGTATGLATYHRAIATLDPSIDTDRIKSSDYDRTVDWLVTLEAQLKSDSSGRSSVAKMLELMPAYLDLARSLPSVLPPKEVAECETLMIHGDFHSFNMTFRWRRFSACYDFDFIRRDLKIMDIAWTIRHVQNRFYFDKFGKKLYEKDFEPSPEDVEEIEFRSLLWFVRRYRKTYRLSRREIGLLPGINLALSLNNVRYFALSNSEEECLGHHEWFEWQLKRIARGQGPYRRALERVLAEVGDA